MIYRATGHLKEKNESKYLVLSSDNELMDKRLKTRLKELTVVKNLNMAKILWRLNSTQMMICHWINN